MRKAKQYVINLVPTLGMRQKVVPRVPRMLPTVEMPYMRPDTRPELPWLPAARWMAKGE
jgi:hypothetical protein